MRFMYSFELNCVTNNLSRMQAEIDYLFLQTPEDEIEELRACYLVFKDMVDNSSEAGFVIAGNFTEKEKLAAFTSAEKYTLNTICRLNIVKPYRYIDLIEIRSNALLAIAYWRSLVEQGKL